MTTNNMYRVGDFVYFETSVTAPHQIRKIEELNKTPQGAVEAKAICFYRRRDVSKTLLHQAEKHRYLEDEEYFNDAAEGDSSPRNNKYGDSEQRDLGYFKDSHLLNGVQSHQAKHRELFLSRQIEILPATHIRGKCNVTLYNDSEPIFDYLNKEDTFFYKFTYDPSQKTLHADRNAIRVGSDYQAKVKSYGNQKWKDRQECDMVYCPPNNQKDQIEQFILIARSIGTLARAYDPISSIQCPELLFSASSASRDFTMQRAHDFWYNAGHTLSTAVSLFLPAGCPKLFKDELEQWSSHEYSIFLHGMEKYGKDFFTIRKELLPWKSLKGIVEFYYMWKSTDKHWSAKRQKSNSSADHKLKQVYIPTFLKPNPAVLCTKPLDSNSHGCESCLATKSPQWYSWGPSNMNCRLCTSCWSYWKRYGGLRNPASKVFPEIINENGNDTNIAVYNGEVSNFDNLNQVGNFKCTQSSCDKEFRVKAQLYRHLHNNHGISSQGIMNGSWDILNHYSKSTNNGSTMNHLMNFPGGRGMMKPRSTLIFKINLRFRLGRVLLAQYIQPKRIAKKPNSLNSSDIETLFRQIEKFPFKSISNNCLNNILKFSLKSMPINDAIDRLWQRKGYSQILPRPDFLKPLILNSQITNGVYEKTKSLSHKRPLLANGVVEDDEVLECEPLTKKRSTKRSSKDSDTGVDLTESVTSY